MSRGDPATRQRVLDAARGLMEERPGGQVSMAEVARRAGVSRQAVYLHFADRGTLLLEVAREVENRYCTPGRQRRVDEATTGRDALREAIALQAWLKPRVHGVVTALDVLRRTDPAAQAAWEEREHARLDRCTQVVRRLASEGDLADGWAVGSAARCFWAVTSQRVWDDLVNDQAWSKARYRRHITALLENALLRQPGAGVRGPVARDGC